MVLFPMPDEASPKPNTPARGLHFCAVNMNSVVAPALPEDRAPEYASIMIQMMSAVSR